MKRIIKVFTTALIIGGIIAGVFYYVGTKYEDEIYIYYRENILKVKENIKLEKNEYFKDKNYNYVQNTNDFIAKDKKHLTNIFYTIINSGIDEFTFYCDENYTTCTDDVVSIVDNKENLSHINNFVHPYNSFKNISTSYDKYGEINVKVTKVYSKEDIIALENKVNEIISSQIKSNMSDKQKIEVIHDYIINHGKYATDTLRAQNKDKEYNKANDILFDGYGLCSSYADATAIFLHKFNIDNYKIASNIHVWNLVKVNNKWLHLDLTWDDPITSTGVDKLNKNFLLIDTKKLESLKVEKHNYDKNVYKEAD